MAARLPSKPTTQSQQLKIEEPVVVKVVQTDANAVALAVDESPAAPVPVAAVPATVQKATFTPSDSHPPEPQILQELPPPSETTFSDTIRKGDTAISILDRAGVDHLQAMALCRAVRDVYNLRHINVGRTYHVRMDTEGHLQEFIYDIDHQQRLVVTRKGDSFAGQRHTIPFTRNERVVVGELSESIYAALKTQGESSRLIHDFADIFAWSVDFATDIQPGDTFRLLIEEHVRQGQPAEYHRILAAELINRNRKLQTVYYDHDDIGGYYQPDGSSMQGMFLRSPLRYTRISSNFTRRRFHPILKRYHPHLGIDYAAPRGTPVRSVAEGTVTWAGRKGANGNLIIVRHHNGYQSYYLHLARFAPGLRRNKRVTQGQIIGYVGSTGRSTGPHLCFRLAKDGKYIHPLKNRSVEGPAVPENAMPGFRQHAHTLLDKLQQVQFAMQQETKADNLAKP
jgi:murein DD-endopeptidase MepM/ murein hydrolase activator NlpD